MRLLAALFGVTVALSGCSPKRFVVNRVGNSLVSGPSVYETDDDPELVGSALPFSLKLVESLLAESPRHRGLLLAACKGYVLYAYAFVQQSAEMDPTAEVDRQRDATRRAHALYLRALGFGLRGLETARPGLAAALERDPQAALASLRPPDVPLLYWSAAALALAIASAKGDAEMIARLPEVEAMLDRALVLDEAWEEGQLHEFSLNVAASRPSGKPDPAELKKRFDRALELSRGRRASLFVAWAESVDVARQDRKNFLAQLDRALAVDVNAAPSAKLANRLAQRRAAWLRGRADLLFLSDGDEAGEAP